MLRRRRDPREIATDPGPVVFDRRGLPVGVRIQPTQHADAETPESARAARRDRLRKTRELEGRYLSLLPFALFYRDPPH